MKLIILLFSLLAVSNAAKILAIFPIPGYSNYLLGVRLLKELAGKGHEVTMLAPFGEKEKIPNYTQIVMTDFAEQSKEMMKSLDMFGMYFQNGYSELFFIKEFGSSISKGTLESSHTKNLLASNQKFDAVIIEEFFNDALKGICFHYNVPCIAYYSMPSTYSINSQVGNPSNPSYIPEMVLRKTPPLDLWSRIQNTILHYYYKLLFNCFLIPEQNKLMHEHFPNAPPLKELVQRTSLVLLNTHVSTSQPIPLVPNMIEIGGHHVEKPKELPAHLQTYLDNSKSGVVYFSMGSNLKSNLFPVEKRQAILNTFAKLNANVLWKFETDLPNLPKNVKIEKWLPQQDILAHPNVKVFISHGGMLSTTEAIYHGIPVVGIPIYGDQINNVLEAANAGFAVPLKFTDLNEENFSNAITEILSNKK